MKKKETYGTLTPKPGSILPRVTHNRPDLDRQEILILLTITLKNCYRLYDCGPLEIVTEYVLLALWIDPYLTVGLGQ